jgi:uncharacterized protein
MKRSIFVTPAKTGIRFSILVSLVVSLSACGRSGDSTGPGGLPPLETGPFKVLIYSRTAGFRHASIEPGILAIGQLGAEHGFEVDATEDPEAFTPENLAQYRVLIWLNTTLTVLDTEEQRQALVNFMHNGGGYVGIHSAADTEHDWPYYGELVGAQFRTHPVQQLGSFVIEAPDHPSVAHLDNPWMIFDEFYSFKTNPRGQVRVLMSIDESSYLPDPNTSCLPDSPTFPEGYSGVMGDHPMSWCHDKFKGRAWYTALGHEIYLYAHEPFLQHILNGILTVARRVEASCAVDEPGPAIPADPTLYACPETLLP